MRKLIIIIVCVLTCPIYAQRISKKYVNAPISVALEDMNSMQNKYAINFIYNELEDFKVTTTIHNKSVTDAIQQLIGFYPIKMTQMSSSILVECIQKTNNRYKGRIIDENNKPAEFANITLLSAADSTIIGNGVSNESGYFAIPCDAKKVIAKVSYIGYKTFKKTYTNTDIGIIQLHPAQMIIKGVTVKASRPQYKMVKGGMTINIENSLLSNVGTASEVLALLPRVSFDKQSGKASVFAKGEADIYINNKKVNNVADLTRLKSDEIKSVDIITSPGAEYNATVQSVIRIKTIKKQINGISISNSSNISNNSKTSGYNDLTLSYQKKGLELFTDIFFSNRNFIQDCDSKTKMLFDNYQLQQNVNFVGNNRWANISSELGINYDIDKDNSIGLSYTLDKNTFGHYKENGTYDILRNNIIENSIVMTNNTNSQNGPNNEINLYYVGKIGHIGIDFNSSYYSCKASSDSHTEEINQESENRKTNTHSNNNNRMIAEKLVMNYSLKNIGTISWGTELTHTKSLGEYEIKEGYVDNSQDNIKENNIAGFAEFEKQVNNWNFNVGMRYEYLSSRYYSFGIKQDDLSRCYGNWFPSISVSWNKDQCGIQFNYEVKTQLPTYRELENDKQYDNQYEYECGNPSLNKSIIHNFETTMTLSWLNISAGYSYIKDAIMWTSYLYNGKEINYAIFMNYPHKQNVNFSIIMSPKFAWYQPTFEAMYNQQFMDSKKHSVGVNLNRPDIVLNLKNMFKISDSFSAIFSTEFDSYGDKGFFRGSPYWDTNFSIHKSFFNKALSINISANDIFNTQRTNRKQYSERIITQNKFNLHDHSIGMTITYNFNEYHTRYKGTGAGNEEKKRM